MAQKFEIIFDASMDVNKIRNAVGEIQKSLSALSLPQNLTDKFTSTINNLSRELDNFERLSSKGFEVKADFSKFEKSGEKILDLFNRLKYDVKSLGASDEDLEKLFPKSLADNIKFAKNALTEYNNATKNSSSAIAKTNKNLEVQKTKLNDLNKQYKEIESRKLISGFEFDKLKKDASEAAKALKNFQKSEDGIKLNELQVKLNEKIANYEANSTAGTKGAITRVRNEMAPLLQRYEELRKAALDAKAAQEGAFTSEKQMAALQKIKGNIENTTATINDLESKLKEIDESDSQALDNLFAALGKIPGIDLSKFEHNLDGAKAAINSLTREGFQQVQGDIQNFINSVNSADEPVEELTEDLRENTEAHKRFDEKVREVDAIKERVTAFFGLSNAINLARSAIRNAFESIKELDATMTEIAVVTDFSVGDMWEQLPEYTRRANELGIATNEAYKASALFYQQGLDTNEVVSVSNETLKLARIASIEAADATDYMTAALRGFSMQIDEVSAKRVNDVYSELAAVTASDVEEISIAMSKVASLAHNANMEFETTAAFLAQIVKFGDL